MYSIYHFFRHLVTNKKFFETITNIEEFPFDTCMLSCQNAGQFPDLAIKINPVRTLFTGGELIELKDSRSYTVSSFNSTIPSGQKEIDKIIKSTNSIIKKQMQEAGDDIYSLPIRDVFYLIRGQSKKNVKVILIHGSFFETVKTNHLISQSFEQVLEERLKEKGLDIGDKIKDLLVDVFSEQESFSKVRNVDKASVKLRFRVMTEVKAEGNILNTKKYPEIKDNTISLIVPRHNDEDEGLAQKRFAHIYSESILKQFEIFNIKHLLNGYFTVFQGEL
ncbi:MAG: hypothetical protein IT273_06365 [Chitinophagales bacterium]|nr:hypothetical protein [Chitinophagales bacterium]